MLRPTRIVAFFSFIIAAVPPLIAADPFDLTRIKPVPDTEPIPIIDFFRPPLLRRPRLSPLGTHIAAEVTNSDDKYQLLCYEIATAKSEMVGASGDKDVYEFTWLDNTRLMFSLSSEKMFGMGLFAADVGKIGAAYPLLQYSGTHLVAVPRETRTRPLLWVRAELDERGQRDGGVMEIDSGVHAGDFVDLRKAGSLGSKISDLRDNNEKHVITRYPLPPGGVSIGYLADKDGHLAFARTSEAGIPRLYQWTEGHWTKCPINLDEIKVLSCGENTGEIIVLGPSQGNQPRPVQFMEAATGKLGAVLLQDNRYDFTGWFYRDPLSRQIVGALYERNGPHVTWFTEEYKRLQTLLEGFFPGMLVRILGSDEARNFFLVETRSDRQPSIYSWVNLEKRSAGLVKNSAPWINPKRMQTMNTTKFKTRDGRSLDAYLTLPVGATKQNPPPLVVLPHGGPWARDTWGFSNLVQFLASRGYAVLQPNYRGSLGYGWMFPAGDEWDFRKMHDDVTDATKAMISAGLVDGERVAIMGTSFGGYLAVSGVVNEATLYRCAVTIAGVFDWENMIKNAKYDEFTTPQYSQLLRQLGDPKKEKDKFDQISPLRHVDRIHVPVFVAHGKEDTVVDVSESKRLIAELKNNKTPYESFLVGGEGHGMAHLKNRVELYQRIETFLAKYLPPQKSSVPAN